MANHPRLPRRMQNVAVVQVPVQNAQALGPCAAQQGLGHAPTFGEVPAVQKGGEPLIQGGEASRHRAARGVQAPGHGGQDGRGRLIRQDGQGLISRIFHEQRPRIVAHHPRRALTGPVDEGKSSGTLIRRTQGG